MKIRCVGDSLIYGFPYTSEHSWIKKVEDLTGITMINRGECGECWDEIFYRLSLQKLDRDYDAVLLLGGMNDLIQGRSLSQSAGDVKASLTWCKNEGYPVILVLPWLCGEARLNPFIERLRDEIVKVASGQENLLLLDMEGAFEKDVPRARYFIWDAVHPADKTYKIMGEYAAPIIREFMLSQTEKKKENNAGNVPD